MFKFKFLCLVLSTLMFVLAACGRTSEMPPNDTWPPKESPGPSFPGPVESPETNPTPDFKILQEQFGGGSGGQQADVMDNLGKYLEGLDAAYQRTRNAPPNQLAHLLQRFEEELRRAETVARQADEAQMKELSEVLWRLTLSHIIYRFRAEDGHYVFSSSNQMDNLDPTYKGKWVYGGPAFYLYKDQNLDSHPGKPKPASGVAQPLVRCIIQTTVRHDYLTNDLTCAKKAKPIVLGYLSSAKNGPTASAPHKLYRLKNTKNPKVPNYLATKVEKERTERKAAGWQDDVVLGFTPF